jgi:deoxyguanosine kinase
MTTPERLRFIAIEGPIGVGKTTLTRALAHTLNASTLLEKPADNPFLARFYTDRARYALPTQMTFLFERVDQFRIAAQGRLFDERMVSDFMFDKDTLFAKLTLSDEEYALYRQVYTHLVPSVTAPDCVIYLHASVSTLMQRIARRGIAMERSGIDEAYLQRLCDAYEAFFAQYEAAPVIRIDAEKSAPALNEEDMHTLCDTLNNLKLTPN